MPTPWGGRATGFRPKPNGSMLAGRELLPAGTSASKVDLLGKYAWYQATSQEHAWPCGSLLPNDLGLFDMLGNVIEWCQEPQLDIRPDRE